PIEYRWVTRFLPLDKTEAEKELKAYRKRWFAKRKGLGTMLMEMMTKSESAMVDQASVNKSRDADQAIQELEDDHVAFGYYTATITVWDKDPQVVTQKIREVERVVNGLGFTTILETLNAVEAWLSSLPGHANANIRAPLMHTLNLAHLIPFSAIWAGPE
ncbi:conjugal transfer protein TrbE, partial [Bacillus halotolerans]